MKQICRWHKRHVWMPRGGDALPAKGKKEHLREQKQWQLYADNQRRNGKGIIFIYFTHPSVLMTVVVKELISYLWSLCVSFNMLHKFEKKLLWNMPPV